MESKPTLPSYDSILAKFVIAPPHRKSSYLLVEGKPDQQFWARNRRTGGAVKVHIQPMKGKDNITGNEKKDILGLPELFKHYDETKEGGSESIRKQVVGIHDDDYDQIVEPGSETDPNLFSTKVPNDLESLLINLWLKKGAPKIPIGMWMMEKKKVSPAIDVASTIGMLRVANRIGNWRLIFKATKSGQIQPWLRESVRRSNQEGWVERVLVPQLIKAQPKFLKKKISRNKVVRGYREVKERCEADTISRFALVNGHDLCKIIQVMNGDEVKHWKLEEELRLSNRWSKINKKTRKHFELFNRIDEWSKQNNSKIFKWQ